MTAIVVGVDGSADARAALRFAHHLGEALGQPVRAVQAWQYPVDAVVDRMHLRSPGAMDVATRDALAELVVEELGDAAGDVEVEVVRGPAAQALLGASRDARMLVVGSRGFGGFRGLLLGSVSQQLAEHAPCPVTVVRHDGEPADPRIERILVGIDGSGPAAVAMSYAADLAQRNDAELLIAYASGPAVILDPMDVERSMPPEALRETVERWTAPLREDGIPHELVLIEGDARSALLDTVHDRNVDLLVVGSRGHGPVGRLLLGSVATSVVQHSDRPVTIVPRGR